jgi:tRNA threonylcarbamoyladenosine biosynthesis protein TsaE
VIEGPDELAHLAGELVDRIRPGSVVALRGPLGAGKTTLIREVAVRLGVDPTQVRSPSFTLVNVYVGRGVRVYHVDLYRATSAADVRSLDLEEFLYDPGAVTLIEWPDVLVDRLPSGTIEVVLDFVPGEPSDRRSVVVRPLVRSAASPAGEARA